ncbi:MAG TPA: aminopeptidase P family N-terminal domain-containing protein [Acidimicrobiales bacterium]|nr:aminopeptidase P family N-terminal domain-containing protein [Acidimicrobiales bacterium]
MVATRTAHLADIPLPDIGTPGDEPLLPQRLYAERLQRLRAAMDARGYHHIVVWADREHSANLAYLSGFDPRFEEALLVVGPEGDPAVLVGNECAGMAAAAPLAMRPVTFQDMSLPGQPRDASAPLRSILHEEGIRHGDRVGVIGWKTYDTRDLIEAPSFLVDELRRAVGASGLVENATDILISATDGLRTSNEVDQIAAFEWAACQTSDGVRRVITGLRPGMTERECARLLAWNGAPLSCHLMLTAGERARLGLLSPGDRPIERGDPFTIAFGIWGALNCRAGFVVEDASELEPDVQNYVERLVAPYFEAVVDWYEALHVGQAGGELQRVVAEHIGDPFFGVHLNPGHLLHLDEWVNSPVYEGSRVELRSGMALQCDIIPATGTPYFTTNIEDGVVLADGALRAELAARYPGAWQRIETRRQFMIDALGIDLHPDVLPLSNLAGHLAPFLLRPDRAMTVAA